MKKFKIPVSWECWGVLEIEAENLEEAKDKALLNPFLPEGEYIDDSIKLDDDEEVIADLNK